MHITHTPVIYTHAKGTLAHIYTPADPRQKSNTMRRTRTTSPQNSI